MRSKHFWILFFLLLGLVTNLTNRASAQPTNGSKAVAAEKNAFAQQGRVLDKPEDIQGTIASVDTTEGTLTITANGIPYVFHVSKKTAIQINGQKSDLNGLKSQVNQKVSVHFVPRSDGNFANSVEVTSS